MQDRIRGAVSDPATILFCLGLAGVAVGCALVYLPAGIVAAGVVLLAGAWTVR